MINKTHIYSTSSGDIEVFVCRKTNFTRPGGIFSDAKFNLNKIIPHKGRNYSAKRDFCEKVLDVLLIDMFEDFVNKKNKLVVNKVEIGMSNKKGKAMICVNDKTKRNTNILFYPSKTLRNIIEEKIKMGHRY